MESIFAVLVYFLLKLPFSSTIKLIVLALILLLNIGSVYVSLLFKKKWKGILVITIFSFLIMIPTYVSFLSNQFINSIGSDNEEYIYTDVFVFDDNFEELSELEGRNFGIIENEFAISSNVAAKKILEDNSIEVNFINYNSYIDLVTGLFTDEVQGIALPRDYMALFDSLKSTDEVEGNTKEEIEEIERLFSNLEQLKSIYQDEMLYGPTESDDSDLLKEPFSVLLLGVDAPVIVNGNKMTSGYNYDAILIATVDINNFHVSLTTLNRDALVYSPCINRYEKINSNGLYGIDCMISTVNDFLEIDIKKYAVVDFEGFIQVVDMIGGVYVDVPTSMSLENRRWGQYIQLEPGYQLLDGVQTLAYVRNRKTLDEGATDRSKNHMTVLNNLFYELLTPNVILTRMNLLMQIIDENVITNFSTDEIQKIYSSVVDQYTKGKITYEQLEFERIVLEYWSTRLHLNPYYKFTLYYDIPYPETLTLAKEKLAINLNYKDAPLPPLNFAFDTRYYPESIESTLTKVLPEGLIDERIMPNFVGKTMTELNEWALTYGMRLNIEEFYSNETKVDIVTWQSLTANSSMNHATSLSIKVSKGPDPMSVISLPIDEMYAWTVEDVQAFIDSKYLLDATIRYVEFKQSDADYPKRQTGVPYVNDELYKTSLGFLYENHPTSILRGDTIVFQIVKSDLLELPKASITFTDGTDLNIFVKEGSYDLKSTLVVKDGEELINNNLVEIIDESGKPITSINTNVANIYKITYKVKNKYNVVTTKVRTITVEFKPATLVCPASSIVVTVGSTFTPPTCTYTDNGDTGIVNASNFDPSILNNIGTYNIEYSYKGKDLKTIVQIIELKVE